LPLEGRTFFQPYLLGATLVRNLVLCSTGQSTHRAGASFPHGGEDLWNDFLD
jgi:hypothetical protein